MDGLPGAIRLGKIAPRSGGPYGLPQTLEPTVLAWLVFHGRHKAIRLEKIAPVGVFGFSSISEANAGVAAGAGHIVAVFCVIAFVVITVAVAAIAVNLGQLSCHHCQHHTQR
ncbi:hypothetical protein TIFTF001_034025 [Ficus carica]|uniref:Uncharacterized protein n=1 Tax=Ficus carica TaxID=3494 RepID=A0AA88J8M4_FICCA|nr:hypothetical protein TIFTF001_034025 [Ficus carica]